MKTSLVPSKTQRLPLPTATESKQKVIDQNPSFSNSFLRQQMFLKPRSEHGELISPQHRESEKIGNLKINGMGGSFVSTGSRSQRREEENFKRMIVDLSHELLVKDSMIDSLRCELMANRQVDLNQSNVSGQQSYLNVKNKSSYHFKSLIEENTPTYLSHKNLSNNDPQLNNLQPFSLQQKATLSQSQFIKVSTNKNIEEQPTSHKRNESFKIDFNALKQNKILLELQEELITKDKQLQTTLHQKKILSGKIIENQRTIIAREAEIKSLKNESKKLNISKDDINRSMDSRKLTDYEDRINRLKRQNINISSQFEELKRSKGEEIESSIREWKKINQTMTDSLVKLNQENSSLTKKLTDLEIRFTNSSTKTVQLQKQNSTLKYNLENQKNSYSTLSLHHKHEKDQYTRRISQLEKQMQKMKSKHDQQRGDEEKLQHLVREKDQNLLKAQGDLEEAEKRHSKQLSKLKQNHIKEKEEQDKTQQLSKQIEALAESFKEKEAEIQQQRSSKVLLEQQLKNALKEVTQLKEWQTEKNTEVQHYKSKVSQLIQKVSQMKIQRINQINKEKEVKIQSFQSLQSSIEVDNQNSMAEKILEENEELKQTIEKMKQQIERLKQTSHNLEAQSSQDDKVQGLEDINRRLGDRIRILEQQILSLRSSYEQKQSVPLNDSEIQNIILHNKNLSSDLLERDQIIHELRESLRRQEDNTINLKIHLDEVNKRLQIHLEILEITNKKLIAEELKFGNYAFETQQVVDQLKEDNEGLEQELKIIYEKLQYFEKRLEESEDNEEQENNSDGQDRDRKRRKESYKKITQEVVSSD